jgi:hypothetical protein
MIEIFVKRDAKGKIKGFEGRGHSFKEKKGKDIVCAAVSTILQTTAFGLKEYLKINIKIKTQEAYLDFVIDNNLHPKQEIQAEAIMETSLIGLKLIEKNYKRYVKIREVRDEALEVKHDGS